MMKEIRCSFKIEVSEDWQQDTKTLVKQIEKVLFGLNPKDVRVEFGQ